MDLFFFYLSPNFREPEPGLGAFGALRIGRKAGEDRKIVMVGLDAAGKTTVLYQMKLHEASGEVSPFYKPLFLKTGVSLALVEIYHFCRGTPPYQ